ncbi:hypothetical protein M5689_024605 [Euphorbia peplus]|nr:hypothetical protein M5689_024605 [Euphorbia peplus]
MLLKAEIDGSIRGCSAINGAPSVTHLLFANDYFLFFNANVDEGQTVLDILTAYEYASGQAINVQKSGIFFSPNVSPQTKNDICNLLNVFSPLNMGRYLGLPSLIVSREYKSLSSLLINCARGLAVGAFVFFPVLEKRFY